MTSTKNVFSKIQILSKFMDVKFMNIYYHCFWKSQIWNLGVFFIFSNRWTYLFMVVNRCSHNKECAIRNINIPTHLLVQISYNGSSIKKKTNIKWKVRNTLLLLVHTDFMYNFYYLLPFRLFSEMSIKIEKSIWKYSWGNLNKTW